MISASAAFQTANAILYRQPIFLLEIDGYSRVLANYDTQTAGQFPWAQTPAPLRQAVSELMGGSSMNNLRVRAVDSGDSLTADLASFVFEGKKAVLKHGYPGMAQADFVTLFTGRVDRVENTEGNAAYEFVCKDNSLLLRGLLYLTGDDGEPTSGDHPKTVTGNPMDILLDILQNELGLAAGEIDTTTIQNYRDQVFAGLTFRFSLKRPPEAKQFIERELLMPLGGYLWVNHLGKISVRFMHPLPGTVSSVLALTDQNLLILPTPQEAELINVVRFEFDDRGTTRVVNDSASLAKYALEGAHTINSAGLRSNRQAAAWASIIGRGIFNLFAGKGLIIEAEANWQAVLLESGDFVALTHSLVPDRKAGTMGVADQLYLVLDRGWDFVRGKCSLRLLDAGNVEAAQGVAFKWAPNGTPDWTAASQAEKDAYMFVADDATEQFSDGAPGHELV